MLSRLTYCLLITPIILSSQISLGQNFHKERVPRRHSIHLSSGPASMYADNGGPYRNFNFPISPVINLGLAKKISDRVNLRATTGFQNVSSNLDYDPNLALEWGNEGKAYAFTGNTYTLDLMPEFYFFTFDSHLERPKYNGYIGIGFGFAFLPREQAIAYPEGVEISKVSNSSPYIPIRLGGSIGISSLWDIGFEASLISMLSDNLDGNADSNKTNDMLLQGQFFVKRYLSPFPFWKKHE